MGDNEENMEDVPIESEKAFKERTRSHYIIFFTQFGTYFSMIAILSSIWPYLNMLEPKEEKTFLGYLSAAGFTGQMVFSVLMGYWSNRIKSTRICFIVTLVLKLISHILQASLESFTSHRKYWFLLARVLCGMGEANITLCRTHISSSTLMTEKRRIHSLLSSGASLAFCLGPALQFVLVPIGEKGFWLFGFIKIDMYTTTCWVFAFQTLFNLILMHPAFFVEYNMLKNVQPPTKEETYVTKYNYKYLALIFVFINFALSFNIIITSIIGPAIAMDEFAMTRSEALSLNSIVRTACYFVSFFIILGIHKLCKLISEMKVFVIGFILMYIGRGCLYPFEQNPHVVYDDRNSTGIEELVGCPLSQTWCLDDKKVNYTLFIIGNIVESIGYAFASTLVVAILSKILGTKQQGTWMGFLTFSGSLGRILSPLFVATVYEIHGPAVVIASLTLFFAISTSILLKSATCLLQNRISNEDQNEKVLKENINLDKNDGSVEQMLRKENGT